MPFPGSFCYPLLRAGRRDTRDTIEGPEPSGDPRKTKMQPNRQDNTDGTTWQAEALRLTTFLSDPPPEHNDWWAEVVGQPPRSEMKLRQEGQLTVAGPLSRPDISNAKLVLRVRRDRIDWILQVNVEVEEGLPDIAESHLGPFIDVIPVFVEMMQAWRGLAQVATTRLALGAVLRLPVQSREEGYSVLSPYLPFNLDPESSDFSYRINRPRPSASLGDDTLINRLMTWQVLQAEILVISLPSGESRTETASREGRPFFACRLELDINTAAERPGTLPQERVGDLLEEFATMAVEIAREGDRP